MMNIVVRLTNIPMDFRKPDTARRLCRNLGKVMEVKWIRFRVQVDISEPLQRGIYLRMGDGTRTWIAFSYERMLVYCYLCRVVGHLEKKCHLWFQEDVGKLFPMESGSQFQLQELQA